MGARRGVGLQLGMQGRDLPPQHHGRARMLPLVIHDTTVTLGYSHWGVASVPYPEICIDARH